MKVKGREMVGNKGCLKGQPATPTPPPPSPPLTLPRRLISIETFPAAECDNLEMRGFEGEMKRKTTWRMRKDCQNKQKVALSPFLNPLN